MKQMAVLMPLIVLSAAVAQGGQAPARTAIDPDGGLTIEQAVAEAVRADPMLAAARAGIVAAQAEQWQAGARPNPDVTFEQREQVRGTDRQTSVGFELPLDGLQRGARVQAAARTKEAAEAGVAELERQVRLAVRRQYGRVLEAARRLDIAGEVVEASRQTYALLQGRVREGAAPPLDRDAALVDLRRLEGARELLAGRLGTALTEMKRLLGRPSESPLTLAMPLEALIGVEGDTRVAPATERADVREALAGLTVAEAGTLRARQESKPLFAIFGNYMRMDAGFSQRGVNAAGTLEPIEGRFHNIAAGLRVSIPLFNRGQGATAAAQAREIEAQEVVRARRLHAASEVAAARLRVEAARAAAAAFSPDIRALVRRNLDVTRETYTLGRATLFDVLNEQRRLLEFESSYTDVLAELFDALTAQRGATGDVR